MEHPGNKTPMLSPPPARPTLVKEVEHPSAAIKAEVRVVVTRGKAANKMDRGIITISQVETAGKEVVITTQQEVLLSRPAKQMWRKSGTTRVSTRSRTSRCRNPIAPNANNSTHRRVARENKANLALKAAMEAKEVVKKVATVEPKAHLTQAKASTIHRLQLVVKETSKVILHINCNSNTIIATIVTTSIRKTTTKITSSTRIFTAIIPASSLSWTNKLVAHLLSLKRTLLCLKISSDSRLSHQHRQAANHRRSNLSLNSMVRAAASSRLA